MNREVLKSRIGDVRRGIRPVFILGIFDQFKVKSDNESN